MAGEIVRTFWHGPPLNAYQLAGLKTFKLRGHDVEVYSYNNLNLPDWLTARDARDIWSTDHVLRYAEGTPGAGSPALHANLFRYMLLYKLGGWWIDMDMVLLSKRLPQEEFYFARESDEVIAVGALKFPAQHPLMKAAFDRAQAIEIPIWAQTGPRLFTALAQEFNLDSFAKGPSDCYPIHFSEILYFFDPAFAPTVSARCESATFLHLSNEIWRRCGIPTNIGPPEGSFLETFLGDFKSLTAGTMPLESVRTWHELYEEGARRFWELRALKESISKIDG